MILFIQAYACLGFLFENWTLDLMELDAGSHGAGEPNKDVSSFERIAFKMLVW